MAHKLLALVTGWHFRVVPFFAAGALAYRLRERIPYSPAGAWCAAGLVIALSAALPREWSNPLSYLLLTAPLSYLILTLGVSDLRPPPPFRSGDYSYGIYLYAFPVQQMVVASGVDRGSWVLNVLVSLPIVTILAAPGAISNSRCCFAERSSPSGLRAIERLADFRQMLRPVIVEVEGRTLGLRIRDGEDVHGRRLTVFACAAGRRETQP